MLRRTEMARQGRDWWQTPTALDDMIAAWNAALAAILSLEGRADVLHLQYEDLVFETGPTLDRLRAFLELDLRPDDPLVRDEALHFDRVWLDRDATDAVMAQADIAAYRAGLEGTGAGAMSLRHLPG